MVVTLCWYFHFQRQFVRDGTNKSSLARSNYARRRSLFSCRLGVAGDGAARVGQGELHGWSAAASTREQLIRSAHLTSDIVFSLHRLKVPRAKGERRP